MRLDETALVETLFAFLSFPAEGMHTDSLTGACVNFGASSDVRIH